MKTVSLTAFLCGCLLLPAGLGYAQDTKDLSPEKLTVRMIARMPNSKVVDELGQIAADAIESSPDPRAACLKLAPGLQMIYTTGLLDAEVNNGGFHQYFWNSSGEFSDIALKGLKLIGDKDRAALLEQAIKIYKTEEPTMEQFKEKGNDDAFLKSEKTTKLSPLDDMYYAIKKTLEHFQIRFIRSHPKAFISR